MAVEKVTEMALVGYNLLPVAFVEVTVGGVPPPPHDEIANAIRTKSKPVFFIKAPFNIIRGLYFSLQLITSNEKFGLAAKPPR